MCDFCKMRSTGMGEIFGNSDNGATIAIRDNERLIIDVKGHFADFQMRFCPMCGENLKFKEIKTTEKYIVSQDKMIMNMRNIQVIQVTTKDSVLYNANTLLVNYIGKYSVLAEYPNESEADAELECIIKWLATDEPVYRIMASEQIA